MAAAAAVIDPNDAINSLTSQLQSTNIKKILKSIKKKMLLLIFSKNLLIH